MQETLNNCCKNMLLLYWSTHAYPFSPEEGLCCAFWSKTIVGGFLHLMVLFCKMIINPTSKQQFVVLPCCIIIMTKTILQAHTHKKKVDASDLHWETGIVNANFQQVNCKKIRYLQKKKKKNCNKKHLDQQKINILL